VSVVVDDAWLAAVRASLPELPHVRRDRFVELCALPRYDADVLTSEKGTADYFEATLAALQGLSRSDPAENAKAVSNWVMTDVLRVLSERKASIAQFPVQPARLAAMISLIHKGTISGKIAKEVFEEMLTSAEGPLAIVERKGLVQVSDEGAIEATIDTMLARNARQVEQYRAGNEKIFGFFVGETMKLTKGKANPRVVNELLRRKLSARKV
jgi:aspartyl-tRNA(Asn)/glutamyl-tRNA(Gln) amidotransferase subunit B